MTDMAGIVSDDQCEWMLVRALNDLRGAATVPDLVVATGLSNDEVKQTLDRMMPRYVARKDRDLNENLRYVFKTPVVPKSHKDKLKAPSKSIPRLMLSGAFLYSLLAIDIVLVTMLPIALPLMLAVCGILLLLSIVVGIIASVSDTSDSDAKAIGGCMSFVAIAALIGIAFYAGFDNVAVVVIGLLTLITYSLVIYQHPNIIGILLYTNHSSELMTSATNIEKYCAGPGERLFKSYEDSKKNLKYKTVAELARANKYILSAMDWSRRTGDSLDESDRFLRDAVIYFNGEYDVTHDIAPLYRFDNLNLTTHPDLTERYSSDSFEKALSERLRLDIEPLPKEVGTGFTIALLLSIAVGATVVFGVDSIYGEFHQFSLDTLGEGFIGWFDAVLGYNFFKQLFSYDATRIILGWVPMLVSGLILLSAIFSRFFLKHLKKRNTINERDVEIASTIAKLTDDGSKSVNLKSLYLDNLEVEKVLKDFDGEVDRSAPDFSTFLFPTVVRERQATLEARLNAPDEVVFGPVATEDDFEAKYRQEELDEFDQRAFDALDDDAVDVEVEETVEQVEYA